MEKINIGIAIAIHTPTESFFENGIRQNAILLKETFEEIEFVDRVYFVNFGEQKDLSKSPWKEFEESIIDFSASLEKLQLLATVCQFVSGDYAKAYKNRGIKLVRHTLGNQFYIFTEQVLFREADSTVIHKQAGYDSVWISPHLYETNKDLFEALHETPAHVGPYVWSPRFLEHHVSSLEKEGKQADFSPRKGPQRVSVMEPNINIVKSSIFPIVALEKFHAKHPELLDRASIFCANGIKQKKNFIQFAASLNIHRDKKVSFESRYPVVSTLARHTDILLAHQWECSMNYLYLDASWLGYPVVHNSEEMQEFGWYYPRFDGEAAVEALSQAAQHFDGDADRASAYRAQMRERAQKYLPKHERNVEGYKKLIEKLF